MEGNNKKITNSADRENESAEYWSIYYKFTLLLYYKCLMFVVHYDANL